CLESIACQTYGSWIATIVNNCSQDKTADIAASFEQREKRFRVVANKEFLSQAGNYNRAIACGIGISKYLKIVEADNILLPDCLRQMVELAEQDPKIGIVGCYYLHGEIVLGYGLPLATKIVDGKEVCRRHLRSQTYYLGTPTTLLFSAKALNQYQPWFREGLFFDDIDLCFRMLRDWKFGFVHQVLAFVRGDNAGIFNRFVAFDFDSAYRFLLCEAYGDQFFSGSELSRIRRLRRSNYYRTLGEAVVDLRSEKYWQFHRKAARLFGRRLPRLGLIGPVCLAALDKVLNPKATITELLRRRGIMRTMRA
ncbi:MAG: glycosyltransferase, partial [Verrucomicrobia bacterium]|nr:glycosyltransferase [Verrucomicrobiota bacterium]